MKKEKKNPYAFSLIGAGKVGISLSHYLFQLGYKPRWVWNRSEKGANQALRWVPFSETATGDFPSLEDVNLVIIAVSDDAISEIVTRLDKQFEHFRSVCIVHVSGVHSSEILHPLYEKEAQVASLHPCQTFPSIEKGIHQMHTTPFVCEGMNCMEFIKNLKSYHKQVFLIEREKKAAYHLATVFASNYLMIFLDTVKDIATDIGLGPVWGQVFEPLISTSIDNLVHSDISDVLTGPIIRGDIQTISKHLEALTQYPYSRGIYSLLGIGAVEVALQKGAISKEVGQKIVELLSASA